ncbi:MAG: glycosyltransferase family 4 protein, partial [Ruminococcaceae bacterium]|nr:glycosyltransferase family 4 protein [Oscillospiraceae bacterium]
IVKANSDKQIEGAKKYFSQIIGEHKSILVADIGWSGSSITALKHFVQAYFPQKRIEVFGTLLLADRTNWTTINISNGIISPYITSALNNVIIAQKQFDKKTKQENNMYTERLFTSTEGSLEAYDLDENGNVRFVFGGNKPDNSEVILEMQRGIKDFAELYNKVTAPYKQMCYISPYIAYAPFLSNLRRRNYLSEVYESFKDDSVMMKYSSEAEAADEGGIFPVIRTVEEYKGKILFISHEMTYTGAPHSLLRVCKVVLSLGYKAEVWSFRDGNFTREFEQLNVPVIILNSRDNLENELTARLTDFKLAVLNTISTDEMAKIISSYIPIIWYIREATNIPEMCEGVPGRFSTFASCRDLVCVSDYAAEFIGKYNPNVSVVHNCVEDVSELCDIEVRPHSKVRFLTLGTIEYRKGYDVLVDAYSLLPDEYKNKAEIVFAGGLRSGFKYYWEPVLKRTEEYSGTVYMGEISDIKEKVNLYAWSDVVVVASRDESCSLVALEGAMMGKALIVTENVGAKYMVGEDNGLIVKTGSAASMAEAMIKMIDNKEKLPDMGKESRRMYELHANMESHRRDISEMIEKRLSEGLHPLVPDESKTLASYESSPKVYKTAEEMVGKQVIVSLTSHPPRIKNIHKCIKTLLEQDLRQSQTILWLAREQFPKGEKELPASLINLKKKGLEIRWCDDLGSHKKYYYTMQENPDAIVITVDDDAYYQPDTVRLLCESYRKYPNTISALRAHSITLNKNGSIRKYDNWMKEDATLYLHPTYRGIGTGIGGILYPPRSLNPEVFNKEKMLELCPNCDDVWLKVMALANGYPTVLAAKEHDSPLINEAQDCALYLQNVYDNANNVCIQRTFEYYNEFFDGIKLLDYLKYPVGSLSAKVKIIDPAIE